MHSGRRSRAESFFATATGTARGFSRIQAESEADMNISSRIADPSPQSPFSDRPPDLAAKPPFLGFGLGLRAQHYDEILSGNPPIDWFQIISENYILPCVKPLRI